MATITKRLTKTGDPYYTVQVRLKGHPAQTATFSRLTDARKWAAATESAIREGRFFKTTEAKKHTLADMVDRYIKDVLPTKPKLTYAQRPQLERWKTELGYVLLADITPALIVEVRDKLLSEPTPRGEQRNPATVVRYMAALSHAFTIAVKEWGWLEDSPMRKVKKPKESRGRVRWLDDNERARLLTACKESSNEWLYTCVVLALSTGMRQGELMGLKWSDVDLKAGVIILHESKNGERRRVHITGHALELLREHARLRRLDTSLLFPSNSNPQKPIDLRKPWLGAMNRACIDDFHWHDLRHCCASYLVMNGTSLAAIAEILGHKDLQMTKRYSHLSESYVSNEVASMNEKIFGGV